MKNYKQEIGAMIILLMMCSKLFGQSCEVLQVPLSARRPLMTTTPAPSGYTKTVSIYIETTNDIYLYCNSDTAKVRLFVNARFEQWRKLYMVDSILIRIDSIGYWRNPEPYPMTSSANALYAFQARLDSLKPTADVCHLLSISPNNLGGISFVGAISLMPYNVSFSNIYVAYSPFPLFNWTTHVTSHECGHILGSNHTQNCSWLFPDGHFGAIDCCWTVEGSCYTGAKLPIQNGTTMSYCNLNGGIDMTLGFGALPKAVIRQAIWDTYVNGLLKRPNDGLKQPPYIYTLAPTASTLYCEWGNNGTEYRFRMKQGNNTWGNYIPSGVNNASISGLTSKKLYMIQVKSKVNGVWSAWSQTYKFKTL